MLGAPNSTYTATILAPLNVLVSLEPAILSFSAIGEVKSFTIKVEGPKISQQPIMSGAIVWSDGVHEVRTPLVVHNYLLGAPYNLEAAPQTFSFSAKKPAFKDSSVYHKNGRNHWTPLY